MRNGGCIEHYRNHLDAVLEGQGVEGRDREVFVNNIMAAFLPEFEVCAALVSADPPAIQEAVTLLVQMWADYPELPEPGYN